MASPAAESTSADRAICASASSSSASASASAADEPPRRFLLFGIESDEPSDVEVMPFDLQCLIIQYLLVPDPQYPHCPIEIRGTSRSEQRRELIALATSSSAVAALFRGIEHQYFDAFTEEFGGWILATIPMRIAPASEAAAGLAGPSGSASGVAVTGARVIEELAALHAETLLSIWRNATPSWAKKGERFTAAGRLVSVVAQVLVPAPTAWNPSHRVPLQIDVAFDAAHSFSYENCVTTLHCTDVSGASHAIEFGERWPQHQLRFGIDEFRITQQSGVD